MRVPIWALLLIGAAGGMYLLARKVSPTTITEAGKAVTDTVKNWIARAEGFSDIPYQDTAGVWTIGRGHKIVPGDGFWSPENAGGRSTITVQEADALQASDTRDAQTAVENNVVVPINQSQKAALLSLAYNIGSGNFSTSSLVRYLNAGDYAAAADQFLVWNKVHDPATGKLKVDEGLVARRAQERELFLA